MNADYSWEQSAKEYQRIFEHVTRSGRMFSSKERFAALFLKRLEMTCGKSFKDSAKLDQYKTLGNMVREYISADWIQTNEKAGPIPGSRHIICQSNFCSVSSLNKI